MARFSPGTGAGARDVPKPLRRSRLRDSFRFAYAGLRYAWRNEPNFRIECGIAVLALLMALWLSVSPVPILLCIGLVLSLELINSSLEATLDLLSPDYHPLVKVAKDAAAAAVLLASIISILVGLWWLGGPLLAKLGL